MDTATVTSGESLGSQSSWRWSRDFAIVGAVSSFLAPALIVHGFLGWVPLIAVTLAGAASGAGLGLLLRRWLATSIGTLRWPLMVLGMGALGGLWGVLVGLVGGIVASEGHLVAREGVNPVVNMFVACATVAAGLQLAWFGTAYHHARRTRAPVWPAVVLACGMPLVGYATLCFLSL